MREDTSFGIIPLKKFSGIWHVLLINHCSNYWAFPKGHANPNETPLESAKRELFEETGLHVTNVLSDQNIIDKYRFEYQKELINKTVIYFIAEVTGTILVQPEEVIEAKWVPLSEAEKHVTFPETKDICRQALKIISC